MKESSDRSWEKARLLDQNQLGLWACTLSGPSSNDDYLGHSKNHD